MMDTEGGGGVVSLLLMLIQRTPFEERLLACQSPLPLITRFRQRGFWGGKTVSVGKRREGRSRRVDRAMMAAPDPLARLRHLAQSSSGVAPERNRQRLLDPDLRERRDMRSKLGRQAKMIRIEISAAAIRGGHRRRA